MLKVEEIKNINIPLPNWWQGLIITVVLIGVIKSDFSIDVEMILEFLLKFAQKR